MVLSPPLVAVLEKGPGEEAVTPPPGPYRFPSDFSIFGKVFIPLLYVFVLGGYLFGRFVHLPCG